MLSSSEIIIRTFMITIFMISAVLLAILTLMAFKGAEGLLL